MTQPSVPTQQEDASFKQQLDDAWCRFAIDARLKVVILKGPWGIGKSHHWDEMLKKHKKHFQSVSHYSYVSLFGIGSVDELKLAISTGMKPLSGDGGGWFANLFGRVFKLLGWIRHLRFKWMALDSGESLRILHNYIQFSRIKNCLICIDDFERREPSLSPSAILGLISSLKERMDCKIVLVFNEDRFGADGEDRFQEYREKVVDHEVAYHPSVEHNLRIVWKDQIPEGIHEVFRELRVRNIRVMLKTRQVVDHFRELLEADYPHLFRILQERIARLTILRDIYAHEVSLKKVGGLKLKSDEEEEKRSAFLRSKGYIYREYDAMVIEYLLYGHLDIGKYRYLLLSNDVIKKREAVARELSGLMLQLREDLWVPQAEIVGRLKIYLAEHWETIDLYDLVSARKELEEIGEDVADIDGFVERSVVKLAKEKAAAGGRLTFGTGLQRFPEVCQRVRFHLSGMESGVALGAVIDRLTGRDGWDEGEPQSLGVYSEEDIRNWIRQAKVNELPLLKLKEIFEHFGGHQEVRAFREKVLEVISGDFENSPLHQRRIRDLLADPIPADETQA
jgi:hypothetical protein